MSDTNKIFSYTNRDYDVARAEGLAKIPTLSEGVWTDLNPTDPGIIMLDYVHALVDMIEYYQDHQALEAFLSTAKERKNLFRLADQLSYKPTSSQPAKVYVTFSTDILYDHDIVIPKNTIVKTKSGIEYITTEISRISANTASVTVLCKQGKLYRGTYTGTGISRYTIIDGEYQKNQKIHLNSVNVEMDSIKITDASGTTWLPIDYIIFSTSEDKVYQTILNPDNTVSLLFGDGERGVVPRTTDVLTVEYLVHDAANGRVGEGAITRLGSEISDKGKYVELNVFNYSPSSGGYEAQDSESVRALAPGAIKSRGRAVTVKDFQNIAKTVPGVYDAKAYDINMTDTLKHYEVQVVIIPEEEYSDVSILTREVYNTLYSCMTPPTILRVSTPSQVPIDIYVKVKRFDTVDEAVVYDQISKTVTNYFKDRKDSIGQDFYPSDLSTKVASIDSIMYLESMSPNNIVTVGDFSIASLGALTIEIE